MTLFERTKEISKKRGMSLQTVAKAAGLSQNMIYQYKNMNPKTETLQLLSDVLGVSVDYLLGNTDDMHTNKKDESTVDLIAAHWGIDLDNLSQEEKAIVMARARDYVKGLVDAFESK